MSVFFYGCITLDGYLADKNHRLDWLHRTGGVEETGYEDFYRRMDITLMGRRTFQEIQGLGDPAAVYPTTENYVFTHRPLSCPGFQTACGDVAVFVQGIPPEKKFGSSVETPCWLLCWRRDWWNTLLSRWLRCCWGRASLSLPKGKGSGGSAWSR